MNDNYSQKLLSSAGFPDPLDKNKDSLEFGLKVGKAIENEWFRRHKNAEARYYDNQYKYHRLRLYARAEQPIGKYKNELSVNGDLSYLNLDWTPVPIIPKFVDVVVNGIANRLFSIKAEAIDKVATERKSKYMIEMEKDMVAKEMLMEAKNELGVDGFVNDPEQLPETREELEIHMQLNYKQAVEIAQEEAINLIFKMSNYHDIKRRFDYDVVVLGVGAMKHSYNPSDGIKIEYVDPANLVYSYSESPWKEDCFYFGEVRKVVLPELRKLKPDLTDQEMREIKDSSSEWDLYHRLTNNLRTDFDKHEVNVLFFTYKVTRERVYKKKVLSSGKIKMIPKEEGWNPSKEEMQDRYERVSKFEDVWYEGALILGTNILVKWELAENMIRTKSDNRLISPFVVVSPRVYDDKTESLLSRMIPFADQIQIAHLKIQQVAARVVPDGVYLDMDGLMEIDLGDGKAYSPMMALQLFFQTGSVVGRSQTAMGEFNHGSVPIKEIQNNAGRAKIQALIELYNFNLQMIRDVTGLNEATDGSLPDSRTLVGVQKLAALNSNTATRHVLDAGIYATRKIAEGVALRVSDILKYSDSEDSLKNAIGAVNVSVLDEVSNIPMHELGIFVEVAPDAQEREYLEQNIQAAIAANLIHLDDAAEIREIKNTKLAHQVMRIRREKKQKQEHERSIESLRVQSEEQTKTAQAQAEAKAQIEQARAQAEIAIETAKAELEMKRQEAEMRLKEYLMGVEFQYNMQAKGVEAEFKAELSAFGSELKKEEMAQQGTQESKIAAQTDTENGLPNEPVEFESQEDSLDGFSLGQFDATR